MSIPIPTSPKNTVGKPLVFKWLDVLDQCEVSIDETSFFVTPSADSLNDNNGLIQRTPAGVILYSNGSEIRLNGESIDQAWLKEGDELALGGRTLCLVSLGKVVQKPRPSSANPIAKTSLRFQLTNAIHARSIARSRLRKAISTIREQKMTQAKLEDKLNAIQSHESSIERLDQVVEELQDRVESISKELAAQPVVQLEPAAQVQPETSNQPAVIESEKDQPVVSEQAGSGINYSIVEPHTQAVIGGKDETWMEQGNRPVDDSETGCRTEALFEPDTDFETETGTTVAGTEIASKIETEPCIETAPGSEAEFGSEAQFADDCLESEIVTSVETEASVEAVAEFEAVSAMEADRTETKAGSCTETVSSAESFQTDVQLGIPAFNVERILDDCVESKTPDVDEFSVGSETIPATNVQQDTTWICNEDKPVADDSAAHAETPACDIESEFHAADDTELPGTFDTVSVLSSIPTDDFSVVTEFEDKPDDNQDDGKFEVSQEAASGTRGSNDNEFESAAMLAQRYDKDPLDAIEPTHLDEIETPSQEKMDAALEWARQFAADANSNTDPQPDEFDEFKSEQSIQSNVTNKEFNSSDNSIEPQQNWESPGFSTEQSDPAIIKNSFSESTANAMQNKSNPERPVPDCERRQHTDPNNPIEIAREWAEQFSEQATDPQPIPQVEETDMVSLKLDQTNEPQPADDESNGGIVDQKVSTDLETLQRQEAEADAAEAESVADVLARMRESGSLSTPLPGDDGFATDSTSPGPVENFSNPTPLPEPAAASNLDTNGEPSVQEYMNQLLSRLNSGGPTNVVPSPVPVSEPKKPAQVQAKIEEPNQPLEPLNPLSAEEYRPRQSAPEKQGMLEHLRQVANQSTRNAVNKSIKQKNRDLAKYYLVGGGIALGLSAIGFSMSGRLFDQMMLISLGFVLASVFCCFKYLTSRGSTTKIDSPKESEGDQENQSIKGQSPQQMIQQVQQSVEIPRPQRDSTVEAKLDQQTTQAPQGGIPMAPLDNTQSMHLQNPGTPQA